MVTEGERLSNQIEKAVIRGVRPFHENLLVERRVDINALTSQIAEVRAVVTKHLDGTAELNTVISKRLDRIDALLGELKQTSGFDSKIGKPCICSDQL
jgi:hypothetical protein